ncbi:TetR/AcrR family transcriptional regulator [Secundilactobacillus folii]|uniref:TetR family transcriptional regulator n=1 Tax=Secundilactobacillus folii TaxID=2678357 RepID=A0A7X2XW17_9LACO|nr:TetR/AcrR family transcriptional regulator [Secundilactobacillus folii]MTV82661.1 TetR family transcriptional regulator [Secundilactobacillus folii]
MITTKPNVRVQQTEEKLYQALLSFKSKGVDYQALTIKQLAEKAGISRQTFYRHYQDKDDIISLRIHNFKLKMISQFRQTTLTPEVMMKMLLTYWSKHRSFFELIEWANLGRIFISNISYMNHKIMAMNNVSHLNDEIITDSYAGATYSFLRAFLIKNQNYQDIDSLVELCMSINNRCQFLFE